MCPAPSELPQVLVLYAHCPRSAAAAIVTNGEPALSDAGRDRIRHYVDSHDKALSMVGQYLLAEGLNRLGIPPDTMVSLVYPPGKRPLLASAPGVRFSIAHTGEWVVCAVGTACEMGVDIEAVENRNVGALHHFFSAAEWERIEQGPDPPRLFYQYWVRKEAIIKAADQVAIDRFRQVDTSGAVAVLDGKRWYLTPVPIHQTLVCCLATDAVPRLLIETYHPQYQSIQ